MALAARPESGTYRLLGLVGPPGSAKSTMVRLLAQEMGLDLAEWQVGGIGSKAYLWSERGQGDQRRLCNFFCLPSGMVYALGK